MYGSNMAVCMHHFPEPHLCFEVSAALLSCVVCFCCSAGQVALVLLGGYGLHCWLKTFFTARTQKFSGATQLNWNNSFTPNFALDRSANKGKYRLREGSPWGEVGKDEERKSLIPPSLCYDHVKVSRYWPCSECYTGIKDQRSAHTRYVLYKFDNNNSTLYLFE